MTTLLEIIYSVPFCSGLLAGVIGQRVYCWLGARHQDKVNPLPDGHHRKIGGISRVWLGGFMAFAVIGYVLLQVDQTEKHYKQLGDEMRRCQVEFQSALKARSDIATENDKLSREQRALLAEYNEANSMWVSRILNLPPEIADLPRDDPLVQQYGQTVTRIFFERQGRIVARTQEITDRQVELDEQRRANPLPEPSCGR